MMVVQIRCDKCGKVGMSEHGGRAHVLRAMLRSAGWRHKGATDTCPTCIGIETGQPNLPAAVPDIGTAGDERSYGNECGRIGCPNCQAKIRRNNRRGNGNP